MLYCCSVTAYAESYNNENQSLIEQITEKKVTIDVKNMSIKEILLELNKQTNINFIITEELSNKLPKRSIKVTDMSVEEFLKELLKDSGCTYETFDNNIVIVEDKNNTPQEDTKVRTITGKVVDSDKKPIAGAMILIKETGQGAITEADGNFIINVQNGNTIEISCMGYKPQNVRIRKETTNILASLSMEVQEVGDVTVVAFGTQKKESVVSAITTVKPMDLKSSSSDLTSSFAGRIAGIIGWQTGGMPGALTEGEMNTQFYIRGITSFQTGANKDPLILLDGVETSKLDLSRIAPEDIETFSVMKDASAAAMYGARGANGVILVTTKKGVEGSVYATARYEIVTSQPTKEIDIVDPLTYMNQFNQAIVGRSLTAQPRYTQERIERTASGKYPDFLYPQNDWYGMMFKNQSINHRAGVTIRGGSKLVQYYASVNYNQDNGMLKTDKLNDFDINIKNNQITYRTNLNIQLNSGIQLLINSSASLDKQHGPATDVYDAYGLAFCASPVDFAVMYPADDTYNWPHLRFGSLDTYSRNPYKDVQSGYTDRTRYSTINKAEYIHNLSSVVKGLEVRASVSLVQSGYYATVYKTAPYLYSLTDDNYDFTTGKFSLTPLNAATAKRTLSVDSQGTVSNTDTRLAYELRAYHSAAWGDHQTSFTAVAQMQEHTYTPIKSVLNGIPGRNMIFSARGTYGYKDRYFFEASFGYNGSERFPKENRFGIFPAGGIAWVVSDEKWMESISNVISLLKFRASYGMVGNDGIYTGSSGQRYIYLPELTTYRSYADPTGFMAPLDAYRVLSYSNPEIQWEVAEKANLGLEMSFLDGLFDLNIDAFEEVRHNIISNRVVIPQSMGVPTAPLDNIGKGRTRGVDLTAKFQKQFNSDFWVILNGTLSYAQSEYLEIEEATDKPDYQKKVGQEISQQIGYIADGLFADWEEIENSPIQGGDVMPGDIRYRDLNNDGVIDVEDATYIGYPEVPALIYGLNGFINYKQFEFSFALQGSGRRTFFINPSTISPFSNDNAMLTAIYEDHWSEDNMTNMPFWPRLSQQNIIDHNIQEDWYNEDNSEVRKSTYFMRSCSFIRVTSLELAYKLPKPLLQRWRIQNAKVFVRANNPFLFTDFDIWDVELGENGFNYPIQKTYALGLTFSF